MKKILLFFCVSFCFLSFTQAQQTPSDSTLKEYVGKYVFAQGSVVPDVTVAIENGELTMASTAGVSPLVKKDVDIYEISAFQGTAKFTRDANKKVTGITIDARGYLLEGTKSDGASLNTQFLNKNTGTVLFRVR
jgi:hypothetical protein